MTGPLAGLRVVTAATLFAGPIALMQNVPFRMPETPGSVRWIELVHGANMDDLLAELGCSAAEITSLRVDGVV